MNDVWIAIGIFAGIALLVILLSAIFCSLWRKRARKRVRLRTDRQKLADLNLALEPFGFAYDGKLDAFYSRRNPWQREMGYCRAYDAAAPSMAMCFPGLYHTMIHMGRRRVLRRAARYFMKENPAAVSWEP